MSSAKQEKNKIISFSARFAEACGTSEAAKIQRLLNVSYQAARNYLNGRLPDPHVLMTIAERTPYSIHWLLTGKGEKFSTVTSQDDIPILARQISELIRQECREAVNEALMSKNGSQPRVVVLQAGEIKSETPKEALENAKDLT